MERDFINYLDLVILDSHSIMNILFYFISKTNQWGQEYLFYNKMFIKRQKQSVAEEKRVCL